MSIHESIPQQIPEQQPNPADMQAYMKHFNVSVAEGNVPTYEGLMDANALASELLEAGFAKGNIPATTFKHNVEPDRWTLSEERYAENFRITRANSLDELTPAQIKTAAALVKAKHAAPETHLEVIKSMAQKRMNLSESIYEARDEKQPKTKWVERQLIHEANGITAASRKEQEHQNSREKTRKAFVSRYAPKLIAHMFSEEYKPGAEDSEFPVEQEKYKAIGIGDSEELVSRAVALEFNRMMNAYDTTEGASLDKRYQKQDQAPEQAEDIEATTDADKKDSDAAAITPTRVKPKSDKPTTPVAFQTYKLNVPDVREHVDAILAARDPKNKKQAKSPVETNKPEINNADDFLQYIQGLSERNKNKKERLTESPVRVIEQIAPAEESAESEDTFEKEKRKLPAKVIKFAGALALAVVTGYVAQKTGFNPLEHAHDSGTVNDTVVPAMFGSELNVR